MQTLIREINRAAELAAVEAYNFMEQQKIKKALAPTQWKQFKVEFKAECENIGSNQFHFEESSPGEFTVRSLRTALVATLRYDPDVPCIHFETPVSSGHFGFHVSADGNTLQFVDGGLPRLIRELKHKIFKTIVH